jgi:tetratricopeptide (TPR) repeat protein
MALLDHRGHALTGATPRALEHYERALAEHLSCRSDPAPALARALADAPGFAMASIFSAYLALGGREPSGVARARAVLERTAGQALNGRERAHLAALGEMVRGEYEAAGERHARILEEWPLDILALQVAHACDYVRGDVHQLWRRAARALRVWRPGVPGHHAVLSMSAFALEEAGHYQRAEEAALRALELEPYDVRAHHAVTHVHEMRVRPEDGIRWAGTRAAYWDGSSAVAVHNWWHVGLFNLRLGRRAGALAVYDWRIRPGLGRALSVLIDASALLWRLHLGGAALGERWQELARHWEPHARDAYCAFNDVHAMMAFAAARRDDCMTALLGAQRASLGRGGTNDAVTRWVGIPACLALRDFGAGRYREAETRLRALPELAHRIGGSRAQHGLIALTLEEAARRAVPRLRSDRADS